MRRLAFLLAALLTSAARDAAAQVQVIPFAAPAPALPPAPVPAPPAPTSPVVPAPVVPAPVVPAPTPAAPSSATPRPTTPGPAAAPTPTGCTAPLPALDLAAADLAAGADAYRALTQRTGAPSAYRYWKVSPAQVAATVRQACALGFAGYGTAPSGSLETVLAARWPGGVPAVNPAAPLLPARSTSAPATPNTLASTSPASQPTAERSVAGQPVGPVAARPAAGPLEELLAGINAARAQGRRCGGTWQPAAPPLKVDIRLVAAAQGHAAAMVAQGFADHVNPRTGSTPDSRARAQGFTGRVSENIRYGTPTVDGALIWWLGSAAHCTNLMNRDWTHVGAGSEVQNDQSTFWVLMLGRE